MYGFLIFLFVVNTFILMLAILMQSDKSSGLSGSFGGIGHAASSTFGTRETVTFLHKLTIILTTSFFVLAIVIGLISKSEFSGAKNPAKSVIMDRKSEVPVSGLPSLDQTTLPEAVQETPAVPTTETPIETDKPAAETE